LPGQPKPQSASEIAKSGHLSWEPAVIAEDAKEPIIADVARIRIYWVQYKKVAIKSFNTCETAGLKPFTGTVCKVMDWPLKIQGRLVTEAEVDEARGLLRDHPFWNRSRLSRELCTRLLQPIY
jgi:hypothetical protein